ncbi:glycosyltransferase [Patescibacteria group bacterium]|nr:glycosyltransferase [Patescibacteria group bacterium]
MNQKYRVAIVHDYLREYGGAERVIEALHELWPDAPVYVAFYDKEALGIQAERFKNWDIRETWITRLPFYKKLFSPYRIFAKFAFADLDLSQYDLVISSSNAYMAKAVRVQAGRHICYCHTPPRSLYGYSTMTDWQKNPVTYIFGSLINHLMRIWDFEVAQKVDVMVANSEETRKRIKKFYRLDSQVIFPPVEQVDIASQNKAEKKSSAVEDYYLYVGRLAKSKNVDLAIKACEKMKVKLKLVGSGQGLDYLQSIAGKQTEFLGGVNDSELADLYANAKALLFPAEDEDFGIVPIEAMAHGVPVIAHNSGGPKETVLANKTGVFFDELNETSLMEAMKKAEKIKFDKKLIQKHAQNFSKRTFEEKILKLAQKILNS